MDKEIKKKCQKLANKTNKGIVNSLVKHSIIMFAVVFLLTFLSWMLLCEACNRMLTTENMDKAIKGTHELVSHVDSVWQAENAADSIAMTDTVKRN